jgi:small-conductance mechanosensitive channel
MMKVLIVLLVLVLVYLSLKGLGIGLKRLSGLRRGWNIRNGYVTSIAFFVWVLFVFWSLGYLFREKFFYPYLIISLIIILVIFLSWYLLNDVLAGVVFRIKHNLKEGAVLNAGKFSGQVKSIHLTHVSMRKEDGNIIRVPYARIIQEVVSEELTALPGKEQLIRIQVTPALTKPEAAALIRATILNNPWSPLNEEPYVRFVNEAEEGNVFEVAVSSFRMKQIQFIEREIENNPGMTIL